MDKLYRYATIAVSGPLRKTFAYQIPDSIPQLSPGQRVVVPFGRIKKVGFFLKYINKPTGFVTKPIVSELDKSTLFPQDLFELCLWMADYYFANPADCLMSALPPKIKTKKVIDYFWGKDINSLSIPDFLKNYYNSGKKISQNHLSEIKRKPGQLFKLIDKLIIEEKLNVDPDQKKIKLLGYIAAPQTEWDDFFSSRKYFHSIFETIKTSKELKEEDWTDYIISKAVEEKILIPQYSDPDANVLEFIKPRGDVATIKLNEQQQSIVDKVLQSENNSFKPYLLHGVTGSGKTIVYCHIAREIIKSGKSVLVLTPEIALTGTTLAYLRGFFGDKVTVIHSSMTDRERMDSWDGIRKGDFQIVVGPRSALFAPLNDIGLIIVDEEHDGSYKQNDPSPRFQGRDSAIMRAKIKNIPIILGSASPSLESYYNATTGRYELLTINHRPGGAVLPEVHVVDMKTERIKGDLSFLSFQLKKKIETAIENNTQSILYLNRRGYSPHLSCNECGHIPACPHCEIKLTFHKVGKKLSCHYCGYLERKFDLCPECNSDDVTYRGVGTQKVEELLPVIFSDAKIMRLDSDTAFGRKQAYDILDKFAKHQGNLLLGTQMVTKGLDLPDVTLVGVLSADLSLDLPSFRSTEKVFAKLLQVAGRCGRSEKKGEVVIQTYNPENPVIDDAARQDYHSFYEREVYSRKSIDYPPFSHIINFIFKAKDDNILKKVSFEFKEMLQKKINESSISAKILGPTDCPLHLLRGQFRRHLFIKTNQTVRFTRMLTEWENKSARFELPSTVKIIVDVDPDDMM